MMNATGRAGMTGRGKELMYHSCRWHCEVLFKGLCNPLNQFVYNVDHRPAIMVRPLCLSSLHLINVSKVRLEGTKWSWPHYREFVGVRVHVYLKVYLYLEQFNQC